jgi:prolyl oligopeptidase
MRHRPRALALLTLATLAPFAVSDEGERLHALFDREWEYAMQESPTWASNLGDRRYNDRWADVSLAAKERRHRHNIAVLDELATFDPAQLSEADRLNLRLYHHELRTNVEQFDYKFWLMPLDHRWGIQTAHDIAARLRFATVKDYDDWIARLRSFGEYMDQTIDVMKAGMDAGIVQPKIVMNRVTAQILAHIVDSPEDSLFFAPFNKIPADIDGATIDRLQREGAAAIDAVVLPAYRRFHAFFTLEYLPACQDGVGAWRLPDGKAMYAARARMYTTTDMTPEQIHDTGLAEVQRIRNAMEDIMREVGFKGSLQDFFEHLKTDPKYYYDNPDDLLTAYRAVSKRIDPLMVKLFKTMPRMPYGVVPVPEQTAPDTTTAYYQRPAADGSRAGAYFVNLYKPETRPRYEMIALSLHEAVPGHHFQIALMQELGDLPRFRRFGGYTAYIEGWGLYSEQLGYEVGLYDDPYDRMGQLLYEMWRAIRLVVDTGIHHHAWTRQQAIDFFMTNSAKSEMEIANEVDRYIAWPGQALAYKIGQLKIRELRTRAEQTLGDRFDVKEFHDVVLLGGAVPLDVLEEKVERWINEQN